MRYSVRKSFSIRYYYVYDNVEQRMTFRGTYEDCQMWIDDPIKLALKQATELADALEEKK